MLASYPVQVYILDEGCGSQGKVVPLGFWTFSEAAQLKDLLKRLGTWSPDFNGDATYYKRLDRGLYLVCRVFGCSNPIQVEEEIHGSIEHYLFYRAEREAGAIEQFEVESIDTD